MVFPRLKLRYMENSAHFSWKIARPTG